MPVTLAGYPISIKNDGIPIILFENSCFYNRIRTKIVEALEKNQYNGFNAIPVCSGAKEFVIVDLNVKTLMNLLSKTPFHNIVTTKYVPPDPRGDPPKPPRCFTTTTAQPIIPCSKPFRKPLNYLKYKEDFDPNATYEYSKPLSMLMVKQ